MKAYEILAGAVIIYLFLFSVGYMFLQLVKQTSYCSHCGMYHDELIYMDNHGYCPDCFLYITQIDY